MLGSAPIPVELRPHAPEWAQAAANEAVRLAPALGENLVTVHHVGSMSIPGICAKPILDLLPVVHDLIALDGSRHTLEEIGYRWFGELGIHGRCYCSLDDPATGRRKIHLHCFQERNVEIERHLAFRDYLRARGDLAREYEALKFHCRDLHPLDSHAYTDCKAEWIARILVDAISFYRARTIRAD